MSKGSEAVKEWRKRTKERMITAMGSRCVICEYDKSHYAMEFHHLDPAIKEFGLGSRGRANPSSWIKIVDELRKCVLLCCRCHREVHDGLANVPDDAKRFDEKYSDYREIEKVCQMSPCPACGADKPAHNISCSTKCSGRLTGKISWDTIDLLAMLKTKSFGIIADELGCSKGAVFKRYKKIRDA